MLKLDVAETRACCQAVVCTAAVISEASTLPKAVLSALLPVTVQAANA